jgi:hypothetical protein
MANRRKKKKQNPIDKQADMQLRRMMDSVGEVITAIAAGNKSLARSKLLALEQSAPGDFNRIRELLQH